MPKRYLLILCFIPCLLQAQWEQPNRFYAGGSLGFGGLYMYGKLSLDFKYNTTKIHIAPGLWYLSFGATQRLFAFKTWRGREYSAILSANWHDDWGLTTLNRATKENKDTRDLDIYQLLPGIHIDLRPQGIIYLEANAGLMYVVEKFNQPDGAALPPANKQYIYPMLQLRLGAWIRRPPVQGIKRGKVPFLN